MPIIGIDPLVDFACRAVIGSPEHPTITLHFLIADRLPNPVFAEAAGILEMIERGPQQQSLYEARLKVERDVRAKEKFALEQGIEQGRQEGEAMGRVKLLQQLLGDEPATDSALLRLSLVDLAAMEQVLQRRLRARE